MAPLAWTLVALSPPGWQSAHERTEGDVARIGHRVRVPMKNKGFLRLWHTRVVAANPTYGLCLLVLPGPWDKMEPVRLNRVTARSPSDEELLLLVTGGAGTLRNSWLRLPAGRECCFACS